MTVTMLRWMPSMRNVSTLARMTMPSECSMSLSIFVRRE